MKRKRAVKAGSEIRVRIIYGISKASISENEAKRLFHRFRKIFATITQGDHQ